MIYEPAANPINEAFTIQVERFLRNLWLKNPRGFMRFIDDLTGKQFLIKPRLWLKGQYDIRKKSTSKEHVTSICFGNTGFQLFLLLDQERVLNQQALSNYITLLTANSDKSTVIMIFVADKNYDMVSQRINDTRDLLSDNSDVGDIFVIKMSHLEYMLTKTDDYGCSYGITKKEWRSEEVSTTLFKHIEQGTLTDEILDTALDQDIYLGLEVNSQGHTLLMEMCNNSSCHPKMIEKLINAGANVNEYGHYGKTPLFVADVEKCKILLKNGAMINHQDYNERNALMYCGQMPDKVQWLIDNNIDVNCRDCDGKTALMYVNNAESANILLKNGADINATTNDGKNVIDCACNVSNTDVLKFLLRQGAIIKPDSDLAKIICDDELVRMVREQMGVASSNTDN